MLRWHYNVSQRTKDDAPQDQEGEHLPVRFRRVGDIASKRVGQQDHGAEACQVDATKLVVEVDPICGTSNRRSPGRLLVQKRASGIILYSCAARLIFWNSVSRIVALCAATNAENVKHVPLRYC